MLATRLANQKLTQTTLKRAEQVVAWFGAMQAQDYAGARWAIALRTTGLTDADVERAFDAGAILRTHVLRPTWHFVTPSDIRWMLALTGPRVKAVNRGYCRKLGLDERMFTRARVAIERALEGGCHLTRAELAKVLRRARIAVTGQPLAHLVMDVELDAAICSGPRRGAESTYALTSERAPNARVLSRDEALAELSGRYFQSHSPATIKDFAWWSGLTMKDARAGVAMAKVEVLSEPPRPDRARGADFLLPNYDEYLIAYRDRGAVIDPARGRNFGVFTTVEYPHQVILDGRLAGSWRRTMTATSVHIDAKVYEDPARREAKAIAAQADRLGRFLMRRATVEVQCAPRTLTSR